MVKLVNRAKVTTPTIGTGTLMLGPVVDGFQSFAAAGVSSGDQVRYVIEDGDAWEIGLGSYSSAGPSLTRNPSESSAGGAVIALSGEALVYITAAAHDIIRPGDNVSSLINDVGYTANTGTVTSVAAVAGSGISISGAPITGAGTIIIANTAPHQATNLSITGTGNARILTSSTGSNASLPVATTSNAGLMATGDKTKLDGIQAGAQVNAVTSVASRTGAVMLNKLDIGLGDVDNTSDASKPISTTVQTALNGKVEISDNRLTNPREWTATTISQTEAEAGTATTRRAFTAQRVRQAIFGWWNGSADKTKLDGIQAGAQVNVATNIGYTAAASTGTLTSSTGANATLPAATTLTAGLLSSVDKTKLDGVDVGAQVNVATNLSVTGTGNARILTSSTGSNASLPVATTSNAGLMATSDKTKLDGIQAGAQVNVATNIGYTAAASAGTLTSSTGANATLPAATTLAAGLLSAVDKTKLDGVDVGAQVNVATNLSVTAGTTAGPTINSSTGANATLPVAGASASGVVTTGSQTFAGLKTFSSTISASISGNAGTATTLQTARSINGTSFNGASNITTASWGIARTLTIGATGKSVNGSGNASWTTEEILPTRLRSYAETTADWNTATTNGWYMGSNAANAPSTTWHIGFVEAHNAAWTTQTVHAFSSDGSGNGLIWRREQNNGIWGGWYRLRWSEDEQDARYAQVNGTGAMGTWTIGVSGNAGTASTLQTARTINGTSFNGSANITTSSWGASRTLTIGGSGKSINGSGNVSWSLAEIGAAAAAHTHTLASLTDTSIASPAIGDILYFNSVAFVNVDPDTAGLVAKSGTQIIAGAKTFSGAVILGQAGTATNNAVRADRTITAGTGLTGGGNLTANRTINAVTLTQSQVESPTSTIVGQVSGQLLAQAITKRITVSTANPSGGVDGDIWFKVT